MNITVLGAGAIGSLWAYKLSQAGHNVSLWTKAKAETTHTIQLGEEPDRLFQTNSKKALKNCDLVLITVKAWQVSEAVLPLLNDIHPDTILLFMHNGMGAVDEIAPQLTPYPVVLATTTQAAYKPGTNQVIHTGWGTTQLGAYNEAGKQCEFLADVLKHALPETLWNHEIKTALWNKLAINCAINPLTAIHQVKNGQLDESGFQEQLSGVTREVAEVMSKEGVQIKEDKLLATVKQVIKATADNHSSMQQDIFHHRRTEIDYINGYLCRTAEKHAISTPENNKLYQRIKQTEQSWK